MERGSFTPVVASFLAAAIRAKKSIVVAGEQGAGKTTLVRALCSELDPDEADIDRLADDGHHAQGSPEEVANNDAVLDAYLGGVL